jgi:uncharacterized protein YgbK (DUF1537 family)
VQFVYGGLSCRVELNPFNHRAPAMTDVLAFNTNSRSDTIERCRRKIEELAVGCSGAKANTIFKKVDSTLRGNVGEEVPQPCKRSSAKRPLSRLSFRQCTGLCAMEYFIGLTGWALVKSTLPACS